MCPLISLGMGILGLVLWFRSENRLDQRMILHLLHSLEKDMRKFNEEVTRLQEEIKKLKEKG